MHYLDGFVGSIQWMISDALITAPVLREETIAQYQSEIRGFHSMLKEYATKWDTHSLPPPHRRSMAQGLTEEELTMFDEYIALRDEVKDIVDTMTPRMETGDCRENQEWNLLVEHIGVILGYPGLTQRRSVDGDPEYWQLTLERVQEKFKWFKIKGEWI